jgi:hypothetical protein
MPLRPCAFAPLRFSLFPSEYLLLPSQPNANFALTDLQYT